MSKLFIELYLDEDVNVVVADLLRARGFIAITIRAVGQLGKNDADQLAYAVSQKMTLLTHNRVDFGRLAKQHFALGKTHYGIIIAIRRSPNEIARRLLLILNQTTADEMQNQLRYI